MELDKGKVLLFVNTTMEEEKKEETKTLMKDLNRILAKYNPPGVS